MTAQEILSLRDHGEMTKEELVLKTREEILALLKEVDRPGMDEVIGYLENSDFFRTRCNSHHKFSGGLAVHSLGVYKEFKKLETGFPEDSIRIVCLLHDICKAHLHGYDHIGRGHHGLRSRLLLDALHLQFEKGERNAIEMHMHRVSRIPSRTTYGYHDLFQHYIHQCDHRDCESFPGGFDSYRTQKSLKYEIDTLLYATHRIGIEIVIDHLHSNKEAFYKAPASIVHHNNFQGGLAKHSMEVYQQAIEQYDQFRVSETSLDFDRNSVTLCSLLHDVCKMDEYRINRDTKRPEHTSEWSKDGPHGIKSLRQLKSWKLQLTDEEEKAIAWHMGNHAKDAEMEFGTTYDKVAESTMLVKLIHESDSKAAKESS